MTQPIASTNVKAGRINASWDYRVEVQIKKKEKTKTTLLLGHFKFYDTDGILQSTLCHYPLNGAVCEKTEAD